MGDGVVIFACSFHMPLFAAFSGYLFQKSFLRRKESMLRHRLICILQPLLVFSTCYWALQEISFFVKFRTLQFSWQFVSDAFFGPLLWFLWALQLAGTYVIFLLSRKICENRMVSAIFATLGSKTLEISTLQCFVVSLFVPIFFSKFYSLFSQYTMLF